MTEFERQASTPPPPRPFTVLGYYGRQGKFKVFAYGATRIMTREQVIAQARHTRSIGGQVDLGGLIRKEEVA